jgi:hypothetical protein
MMECAHCHTVTCDGCADDNGIGGCEACAKMFCGACSKLGADVLVECARCNERFCAACARAEDIFLVCDGCPDDSDGEMVMMCAGCREMEDEMLEEFGAWEF